MERIRVVHAPARTPYARKLSGTRFRIVNGTTTAQRATVPRDMTLRWLLAHLPFDWFDVLHLHHVEFDSVDDLQAALTTCAASGKRVVYTAHDIDPVFTDAPTHRQKHALLAQHGVSWVCLTEASRCEVERRFGVQATTIPHGYVVEPATRTAAATGAGPRYLVFGALRDNRDVATVLHNWRFGRAQRDASLSLLLRAPGHVQLQHERESWALISAFAAAEPRLKVDVLPFPTDDDVLAAALACDALVLPYRWGSHSGQLELAFDTALLAVASAVGYLHEQYQRHADLAEEPIWFDWSGGAEHDYGARFLVALDEAGARLRGRPRPMPSARFIEHRLAEHESIIASYERVYER